MFIILFKLLAFSKDEDNLLDETASIQPDFIVILSDRVEKLEQLVGALSSLVFQKLPKVLVLERCWQASKTTATDGLGNMVTVSDHDMLFRKLRK